MSDWLSFAIVLYVGFVYAIIHARKEEAFERGFKRGTRMVFAWPVAWTLFWTGHGASLVLDRIGGDDEEPSRIFHAVFITYQWTMGWSHRVQEWAERGVHLDWFPWRGKSGNAQSGDIR